MRLLEKDEIEKAREVIKQLAETLVDLYPLNNEENKARIGLIIRNDIVDVKYQFRKERYFLNKPKDVTVLISSLLALKYLKNGQRIEKKDAEAELSPIGFYYRDHWVTRSINQKMRNWQKYEGNIGVEVINREK